MEEKAEGIEKKICRVCGEEKPLTEFHRNKTSKLGRRNICKKCRVNEGKIFRRANRESIRDKGRRYYHEHKEQRLIYARQFYLDHKVELNAHHKNYYYIHLEQQRARSRKYRNEHKDQCSEVGRKYRQTENGRFVERHKHHRRRASERASKADLTPEQWQWIRKNQKFKCNICGKKFTKTRPATMDHIIPLSKGGDLTSSNIQALCKSCNSSKRAKTLKCFIISWNHL